jgi:S-adenosylmethionine/arginine decarboxylase-like enzyme
MPEFLRVTYFCDLYHCREDLLTAEYELGRLLKGLALEIGMEAVSEPLICRIASAKFPDVGYSGSIIIAQSHCNFHCYLPECRVEIAIDSCQLFDPRRATAYVARFFSADSSETTFTVQEKSSQLPIARAGAE